jgi:hypothetical protein
MGVHERAEEPTSMGGVSTIGRVLLIATFTGVETAALAGWLALVRDAPVASRAVAIGVGILLGLYLVLLVLALWSVTEDRMREFSDDTIENAD